VADFDFHSLRVDEVMGRVESGFDLHEQAVLCLDCENTSVREREKISSRNICCGGDGSKQVVKA
jgi:hypothetical protein